MINKDLKELLEEKAFWLLGKDLSEFRYQPPHSSYGYQNGYDLRNTLFNEYAKKYDALRNEYEEKLREAGIDELSNSYMELGKQIAKQYPHLLEVAKGKIWQNMEEIVVRALGGNGEY